MPPPPSAPDDGQLVQPSAAEQKDALRQWRMVDSGMDGPRGVKPPRPDDPVAYRLLEAAEVAMERGDRQRGVHILKLVVRDYRQSAEAAFARRVIDQLAQGRDR